MSIIIPAYNEGKRISDTLDTIIYYLRSKSYTWEILVVDDGSTDNTMDLLREYTRSDTQCGFKCFNKARTIRLFEKLKTNGWAFDVEILYKALNSDITVHELPIDWHHNTDSKVRNLQDSIRMLLDVVLIRLRKYNA